MRAACIEVQFKLNYTWHALNVSKNESLDFVSIPGTIGLIWMDVCA